MIVKRETFVKIKIMDNWGNSYPLAGKNFDSIEDAQNWLNENFESYILDHHKWSAKQFKRKVEYPDYYVIRQEVTKRLDFQMKPHEFTNELQSMLEDDEKIKVNQNKSN